MARKYEHMIKNIKVNKEFEYLLKLPHNIRKTTNKNGNPIYYAIVKIDNSWKLLHRVIMNIILEKELTRLNLVDHINHNTLDNRKENLRIVTYKTNSYNRLKRANCASKYKGVYVENNKFRAKITVNGKIVHLGYFNSEKEAAQAYNDVAIKHDKKHFLINDIE